MTTDAFAVFAGGAEGTYVAYVDGGSWGRGGRLMGIGAICFCAL